jgi:hypothetical protein
MVAIAINGPLLVTAGPPSAILKLPRQLVLVKLNHRNAEPPHGEQEIDAVHPADQRCFSRGQAAELKELRGEQKLGFPDKFLAALSGGQQNTCRKVDSYIHEYTPLEPSISRPL